MRILVIIPTYNEIENISTVISRILSIRKDIEVLVIDDNSIDCTSVYVSNL